MGGGASSAQTIPWVVDLNELRERRSAGTLDQAGNIRSIVREIKELWCF